MLKSKKSLSQNFLIDKNICRKIIELADIKNKKVIEIGPGHGFLTDFIISHNPKLIYLIEKDNNLYYLLKQKYKNKKNIKIINKDILKLDKNIFKNSIIISNLPYNISVKIIIFLFKHYKEIKEMIFMIQKEVAYKFDYHELKMNKYKFFTKLVCTYKRCFNVPPTVFKPKPKVESTVVKFIFNKKEIDLKKIDWFINIIFKNRRKKIKNKIVLNSFKNNMILDKRSDQILLDELISIYNFI